MQDVRGYYDAAFRPDLTTIVVIGKVSAPQAKAVDRKIFRCAGAPPDLPPATDLPPVPLNKPRRQRRARREPRAGPRHARRDAGLARSSPDYYALDLGNNVLGGAFYSTRLTRDIRKEAGLVYYVQSALQFSRTRGIYLVQYACDPQNVGKVHDMVAAEIRQMQQAPVTADELERAKALLLRRIPLDEASVDDIAQRLRRAHGARRCRSTSRRSPRAAISRWVRRKYRPRSRNGCGPTTSHA